MELNREQTKVFAEREKTVSHINLYVFTLICFPIVLQSRFITGVMAFAAAERQTDVIVVFSLVSFVFPLDQADTLDTKAFRALSSQDAVIVPSASLNHAV